MTNDTRPHIVIVGAGPAGIGAALAASMANLRVTVIDDQLEPGGQVWRSAGSTTDHHAAVMGPEYVLGRERIRTFLAADVEYLPEHTVWNIEYEDEKPVIYYAGASGSKALRPHSVILATGAIERPFPIPGWNLPGVMTAGALQILLKSAELCPDRAVLAGAGPLLWLLASQMVAVGQAPLALIETVSPLSYLTAAPLLPAALRHPRPLKKGLGMIATVTRAGVPVYRGARNLRIEGDFRARSVTFDTWLGNRVRVEAETVGLHCGVVPNQQASRLLRLKHTFRPDQRAFAPDRDQDLKAAPSLYIVGDGAGIGGAEIAWLEGQLVAGIIAGSNVEAIRASIEGTRRGRPFIDRLYLPSEQSLRPSDETILCRCENVTAGRVRQTVRDGAMGPNQVKFMLRAGMGPCQGRVCGMAVTEVVAQTLGKDLGEAGYYRIRPPLKPIPLQVIAGACKQPTPPNTENEGEQTARLSGAHQ